MKLKHLAVAVVALTAGGCLKLSQPAPEIQDYNLNYPSPTFDRPALPAVLSLPGLGIAATYDREAIVYRTSDYQVGKQFYHRWATNPADMIGDLLARDFSRAHGYQAVLHQRSPVGAGYVLAGEIEAIEERVTQDGCNAILAIRFLLVRQHSVPADAVMLRPRFEISRPVMCNHPAELARELSASLEQLSNQLQTQVYEAIAADLASGE